MPKESWNKNINYADVNYCPLRYADVVLMAAEAYNETGTDRQKAWDLLNSVRTRAEATSITEANYDEMMSARKKTHNLTFIDDSTRKESSVRLSTGNVASNWLLKDNANMI